MSYFLTEEQELMRNTVREFTEQEVKPQITAIEKTNAFPLDLWKRCSELGLTGVSVEEKYGGLGLDVTTELLVMQEIAKTSPTLALILDAHMLSIRVLEIYGTEEQRLKYLVPSAPGQIISAYALTDPAGSTNFKEWSPLGITSGDEIILNGTKLYVTNSHVADYYTFFGIIDDRLRHVIVDKGMTGLETGHIEHKMGLAGTSTGTVRLRNVRVPKSNLIPLVQHGFPPLDVAYLNISAIALGLSEGVFERTKQYVLDRTRFRSPLGSFQAVAHHISQMATKIEYARSMIYSVARLYDEKRPNLTLTRMCKAMIPEWSVEISSLCLQLHGASGYCEDTGIARYMRDAKGLCIGEAPTDIHWDSIAKELRMPIKTVI